jgi:hypothetical protein
MARIVFQISNIRYSLDASCMTKHYAALKSSIATNGHIILLLQRVMDVEDLKKAKA